MWVSVFFSNFEGYIGHKHVWETEDEEKRREIEACEEDEEKCG